MSTRFIGGRTKARRYAMQALYNWAVTHSPLQKIEADMLSDQDAQILDKEYFLTLLYQIPEHVDELEHLMQPYLHRKVFELDTIERAILQIAVYELRDRVEIPYRVVINEALELTKNFGATDSFKFVNGVLDGMAKMLRKNEFRT